MQIDCTNIRSTDQVLLRQLHSVGMETIVLTMMDCTILYVEGGLQQINILFEWMHIMERIQRLENICIQQIAVLFRRQR